MPKHYERFPRTVLIARAAQLDSLIQNAIGGTVDRRNEAASRGIKELEGKYTARFTQLEQMRQLVTQVRQLAWDLD